MRDHAPHGVGSLQLFVPARFEEHYFTLHEADDSHDDAFRRVCAFDFVINNTDRKSGHCLLGTDGEIWVIDHGVALHREFKLRTVIWDFADEAIPADVLGDLAEFVDDGPTPAAALLLDALERDAVCARARALLDAGRFPDDDGHHRWPWPLV